MQIEAYIIDTETTGFQDPIEVIELGALGLTDPVTLTVADRINTRYRPAKPIELGALATHHILDEELVDCCPSSSLLLPLMVYAIGHNVDYDCRALGIVGEVKRIDTCCLAKYLVPGLTGYSQSALIYHFYRHQAREWLTGAHSAYTDVVNCHRLLAKLQELAGCQTWEELWRLSEQARIPKTIGFGKHKGKKIEELDAGYCQWYLKQNDIDQYMAKAMKMRLGWE